MKRTEKYSTPSGMGRKCPKVGHIGVPCVALVMLVHALQHLDNAMEMPYLPRLEDDCGMHHSTLYFNKQLLFCTIKSRRLDCNEACCRFADLHITLQLCTDRGARQ